MGRELYEASEIARYVYETASDITDVDLMEASWGADQIRLNETVVAQPALAAYLLSKYLDKHEKGFTPDAGEGHSAGEIALLGMAKVLSIKSTFEVLKARSEAMLAAHKKRPGKMAYIRNLTHEEVQSAIQHLTESGRLKITNLNTRRQQVISGDLDLIEKAGESIRNIKSINLVDKIKRAKFRIMPIEIAAHSPYHMKPAEKPFHDSLCELEFRTPEFDIMLNNTRYLSELGTDNLPAYLSGQLTSGVDFVGGTERLFNDGIRLFYDPGPKPTMAGLVLEDYEGLVEIVDDESLALGFTHSLQKG